MGDWYTIGVAVGAVVALGVLAAGMLAGLRLGFVPSALAAAGAGLVVGLLVNDWAGGGGGAIGGVLGAVSAAVVVRGAHRRGATVGGTALLLAGASIVVFGLALIPVVGYVEAVVIPALAARMRSRTPERYAGLRTLAK